MNFNIIVLLMGIGRASVKCALKTAKLAKQMANGWRGLLDVNEPQYCYWIDNEWRDLKDQRQNERRTEK